jgi:hypothetical protein
MRIRTTNNHRRSRDRRAFVRHWMTLSDNCEICLGAKGGVRGNENVIGGIVACDYCHADGSADREVAERSGAAAALP